MPDREKMRLRQRQGCGCGQGVGQRSGPDYCMCPACGERQPHLPGVPCREMTCPRCGGMLKREFTPVLKS